MLPNGWTVCTHFLALDLVGEFKLPNNAFIPLESTESWYTETTWTTIELTQMQKPDPPKVRGQKNCF